MSREPDGARILEDAREIAFPRYPGTEGDRRAIAIVSRQFEAAGLEVVEEEFSYDIRVAFRALRTVLIGTALSVAAAGYLATVSIVSGAVVLGAVRSMHDAGVDHVDLNLGNLLLAHGDDDSPRCWIIDFDRARLGSRSLSFARRQRALRRLERSLVKRFGDAPPLDRDQLYRVYAGEDAGLASRLEQGRGRGRDFVEEHHHQTHSQPGRRRRRG